MASVDFSSILHSWRTDLAFIGCVGFDFAHFGAVLVCFSVYFLQSGLLLRPLRSLPAKLVSEHVVREGGVCLRG